VDNDLGLLIASEVERAQTDYAAYRARARDVLATSGALITLIGGFLALAIGKDADVGIPRFASWAVLVGLLGFGAAAVCVLRMYLPYDVRAPAVEDLRRFASDHWDDEGWDMQVAVMLTDYLGTLRTANASLARWLMAAVALEALGILATGAMAATLIFDAW
jgi:hypothetical protein